MTAVLEIASSPRIPGLVEPWTASPPDRTRPTATPPHGSMSQPCNYHQHPLIFAVAND